MKCFDMSFDKCLQYLVSQGNDGLQFSICQSVKGCLVGTDAKMMRENPIRPNISDK